MHFEMDLGDIRNKIKYPQNIYPGSKNISTYDVNENILNVITISYKNILIECYFQFTNGYKIYCPEPEIGLCFQIMLSFMNKYISLIFQIILNHN